MGTFDVDRAALDEAYATGMDRIAVELDGEAPKPKPAAPVAVVAAKAPAPVEDTGPGFFSRLWSGIGSAAGKAADLASDVASRVEVRGLDGARANALAQLAPPPRPEPPYGMILGAAAAAIVLVYVLFRKS